MPMGARQWGLGVALVLVGAAAYAHVPILDPLPTDAKVDRLLVLKSARKLVLLQDGQPVREYPVALGRAPEGAKEREGDARTPEGEYTIDSRHSQQSRYHMSLHISYPSTAEEARAKALGVPPGGAISLHGIRDDWRLVGRFHRWRDWTTGCIAVTNDEIEEIWRVVPVGVPIEIRS